MELYQALVFCTVLLSAVLFGRVALYVVTLAWFIETVVLIFAPWLIAVQLSVLAISFWFGLKIVDGRDKKTVLKNSEKKTSKRNFSGRIHIITTQSLSLGEIDFERILSKYNLSITEKVRMRKFDQDQRLPNAISTIKDRLQEGDILAIVRGGGDVEGSQFRTYQSEDSVNAIHEARSSQGAYIVLGVGHAPNKFLIDGSVDYIAITPTEAAYHVSEVLEKYNIDSTSTS